VNGNEQEKSMEFRLQPGFSFRQAKTWLKPVLHTLFLARLFNPKDLQQQKFPSLSSGSIFCEMFFRNRH
jgi:hypothetical protein